MNANDFPMFPNLHHLLKPKKFFTVAGYTNFVSACFFEEAGISF